MMLGATALFVISSIGFSNVSNAACDTKKEPKKHQQDQAMRKTNKIIAMNHIKPHHPQVALNQPSNPPQLTHAVDLD